MFQGQSPHPSLQIPRWSTMIFSWNGAWFLRRVHDENLVLTNPCFRSLKSAAKDTFGEPNSLWTNKGLTRSKFTWLWLGDQNLRDFGPGTIIDFKDWDNTFGVMEENGNVFGNELEKGRIFWLLRQRFYLWGIIWIIFQRKWCGH